MPSIKLGEDLIERVVLAVIGTLDAYGPAPLPPAGCPTTGEAARVLGVAQGTVKAQLARARSRLERLMRRALAPQPQLRLGLMRVAPVETERLNV